MLTHDIKKKETVVDVVLPMLKNTLAVRLQKTISSQSVASECRCHRKEGGCSSSVSLCVVLCTCPVPIA